MTDYSGLTDAAKEAARSKMACDLIVIITTLAANSKPGATYTRACIDISKAIVELTGPTADSAARQAVPNIGGDVTRPEGTPNSPAVLASKGA